MNYNKMQIFMTKININLTQFKIQIQPVSSRFTYTLLHNYPQLTETRHQENDNIIIQLHNTSSNSRSSQAFRTNFKCICLVFDKNTLKLLKKIAPRQQSIIVGSILEVSNKPIEKQTKHKNRKKHLSMYETKPNSMSQQDFSKQINPFEFQKQQQHCIYVTKLHKQLQEMNRMNLFYQYVWDGQEIQLAMEYIQQEYGQYKALVQKRRTLKFIFSSENQQIDFMNNWNNIQRQLLLEKYQDQSPVIKYYVISRFPILQPLQETSKLLFLPKTDQIKDMLLVQEWIIIAAETYLLFVHNYSPMEYFKYEHSVKPIKLIQQTGKKRSILAIDSRRIVFTYHLEEKTVRLHSTDHVPFLLPRTLITIKGGFLIAGFDLKQIQGQFTIKKISNKRSIFIVSQSQKKLKGALYNSKIQLIQSSLQQDPLQNLGLTNNSKIICCSWRNRFFLASLDGHKLLQIELKTHIMHIQFVPFMFNILNFVVLASNRDLVRIGVESCGQTLGAQVCRLKTEDNTDFDLASIDIAHYEIFVSRSTQILKYDYCKDTSIHILKEQGGTITKMASNREGLAYILEMEHSMEIKYLQL